MATAWTAPAQRRAPDDPLASAITGVVVRHRQQWPNDDGSFTLLVELADGVLARGRAESKAELKPQEEYRFLGVWRCHARYGWQFHYDIAFAEAPDDLDGVAAYLARHAERVGAVSAGRLVAAYGRGAVAVLCERPERPVQDGILSEADAMLASASLRRVYADPVMREAHVELAGVTRGMGFPAKMLAAALRRWRARAAALVRRDPFQLMTAGLPGAGFMRCDRLWTRLGLPQGRLKRQALAAWYALDSLQGDTWTQASTAMTAVRAQIGGTEPRERRAVAMLCRASLAECRADGGQRVWIAERRKAVDERAVAHHLRRLAQAECRWPALDGLLDPAADRHQFEALRDGLSAPVALLTGGPGTGKTHCAAQVCRALVRQVGAAKVGVCAPTGKAAVRISQKLQEAKLPLQARTIHGLLSVRATDDDGFSFAAGEDSPLGYRYLVVDEASMVDTSLLAALLRACAAGTHLLLVGDPHQLPPVGHGAPLRDLIAAKLPRAHLSEVRRNSGLIVEACHQLSRGKLPQLPQDVREFPASNLIHLGVGGQGSDRQRNVTDRIDAVYEWLASQDPNRLGGAYDPIETVQVICARNDSRERLNLHLQARLNPGSGSGKFRVGDKVICRQNGWAVDSAHQRVFLANGDIGRVMAVREQQMVVRLALPTRVVAVPLGGMARQVDEAARDAGMGGRVAGGWELAYAVTCHKYQGSEVPVAIVVADGAGRVGSREWLYTALSRARHLCVVVGDRADLRRCVDRVTLPDRKTFLVEEMRR